MPTPTFPALPSGAIADSSKFGITLEDNTLRQEIEGGYVVTRARTTRKSRRVFSVGYTCIAEQDRAALEAFWQTVSGNAVIFLWTSPQDELVYSVRFKGKLKFSYVGAGLTQRWDCSFELEQA